MRRTRRRDLQAPVDDGVVDEDLERGKTIEGRRNAERVVDVSFRIRAVAKVEARRGERAARQG